jgi:hypothetical protein
MSYPRSSTEFGLPDQQRGRTRLARLRAPGCSQARIAETNPPRSWIMTAKLNDVDSKAWLADALARIAEDAINAGL